MQENSKSYFNRLDSLRFLAFFLVFINHVTNFLHFPASVGTQGTASFTYFQVGDLGVGFFFVLSGFLITYLLEKERNKTGAISLKNFYIRRVLRIWPLYFLGIGIVVLISYFFKGFSLYKIYIDWHEISYHFFFLGNYFKAFHYTSNEIISVFWSIAVEEQFYIVWPLLFILFRKHINYILGLGIIVSMAYRYHYANQFPVREFYTFCVMIYLIIGSLAGIYGPKIRTWLQNYSYPIVIFSVFGFLTLLSMRGFYFGNSYPQMFIAVDGLLFSIFFALIILVSAFGNYSEGKKNKFQSITEYLGTISYGLYVYHLIVLTLVLNIVSQFGLDYGNLNLRTFVVVFVFALILVIAISSLSYKFIEKPFLRLKEKFVPREK